MDLDLSGINHLAVDLGKVGVKAAALATTVVKKSAYDIERDAKMFAPVDTGNLKNSIGTDYRGLSAEVGPTAEYGLYVEEGTSTQGPAAYMGPALDRHAGSFEQAIASIAGGLL